jgi:hypothetical protein
VARGSRTPAGCQRGRSAEGTRQPDVERGPAGRRRADVTPARAPPIRRAEASPRRSRPGPGPAAGAAGPRTPPAAPPVLGPRQLRPRSSDPASSTAGPRAPPAAPPVLGPRQPASSAPGPSDAPAAPPGVSLGAERRMREVAHVLAAGLPRRTPAPRPQSRSVLRVAPSWAGQPVVTLGGAADVRHPTWERTFSSSMWTSARHASR